MKKNILILILIIIANFLFSYTLPKVLFITTGDGDGRGTVSDGVILAMQEFNQNGAIVKLDNRKLFYDIEEMMKYQIMVLPTAFGYHDADRKYSLSYLSETEMINIKQWVKGGGILVSDNFLGRNRLDGSDRITISGKLDKSNWLLSECFGVELIEKNMQTGKIVDKQSKIWKSDLTSVFSDAEWTTVINKQLNELEVWAEWQTKENNYPAITINKFGKGKAVLLANFNLIHPASDGGFSSSKEIEEFYHKIFQLALDNPKFPVQLHPWKNAHPTAFAISFDDGGTDKQYSRVIDFIEKNRLSSNFFVTNTILPQQLDNLKNSNYINMALHSASRADFRTLSYSQTLQEIQLNQVEIPEAKGFRFPFTNNSYNGLLALDEQNLQYDSSIAMNHLEFYRGSIFPYNIPVFSDGYFKSLDVLEISQIFHDDSYFYDKISKNNYSVENQLVDSKRFSAYLTSLWSRAIKPNNGMMIISAQPMFAGYSEITIEPLQKMLDLAKEDNSWICSIDELAEHWNKLLDLKIEINEEGNELVIKFETEKTIDELSLKLAKKPREIIFKGKYIIKQIDDEIFLILEEVNNLEQVIVRY